MKVAAVTTFNRAGLAQYGQRMLTTFDRHWSCGVPLYAYAEGWSRQDLMRPVPDALTIYELLDVSPWLADFKQRHAKRPTNDFRYDAVRFAHKVAAITHAFDMDYDYFIWLDGDVITHADFDAEHLLPLLPVDEPIAWLSRDRFSKRAYHPECGFYILNKRHPLCTTIVYAFERMYTADTLFQLPEYHDSYVLQHVVNKLGTAKNLSGDADNTHHPLVNGPLGQWFDHLKGDRKRTRRSHQSDLLRPRQEAYWK